MHIAVRGGKNVFENSDLPADDIKLANKTLKPVLDWKFKKQNGASCDGYTIYGTAGKNDTEAFQDFFL